MNIIKIMWFNLRGILVDEQKRAKAAQFNQLVIIVENNLGRAISGNELRVLYSLDEEQAETITKWMKEVAA